MSCERTGSIKPLCTSGLGPLHSRRRPASDYPSAPSYQSPPRHAVLAAARSPCTRGLLGSRRNRNRNLPPSPPPPLALPVLPSESSGPAFVPSHNKHQVVVANVSFSPLTRRKHNRAAKCTEHLLWESSSILAHTHPLGGPATPGSLRAPQSCVMGGARGAPATDA